jgi:hypothetical protein
MCPQSMSSFEYQLPVTAISSATQICCTADQVSGNAVVAAIEDSRANPCPIEEECVLLIETVCRL